MRAIRFVLVSILLSFLALLILGSSSSFATPTSTPTVEPLRSLFDDDTCVPPCWFGLIAGQSTAQDVATFVHSEERRFRWEIAPDSVLDLATGNVLTGSYYFTWIDFQREDISPAVNGGLALEEGILSYMLIVMNRFVTLDEVLHIAGGADIVQLDIGPYAIPYLHLIYSSPFMEVILKAQRGNCNVMGISSDFWVNFVVYYSPQAWQDLEVGQPASDYGIYDVPPETWTAWLNGEANMTCAEAWEQLSPAPGETED